MARRPVAPPTAEQGITAHPPHTSSQPGVWQRWRWGSSGKSCCSATCSAVSVVTLQILARLLRPFLLQVTWCHPAVLEGHSFAAFLHPSILFSHTGYCLSSLVWLHLQLIHVLSLWTPRSSSSSPPPIILVTPRENLNIFTSGSTLQITNITSCLTSSAALAITTATGRCSLLIPEGPPAPLTVPHAGPLFLQTSSCPQQQSSCLSTLSGAFSRWTKTQFWFRLTSGLP